MLYADEPTRRARQVVFDASVLVWVVVWARVGYTVYHHTAAAESGAHDLSTGGVVLRTNMGAAANAVRDVPLVGDQLHAPLAQAQRAGTSMDQAGQHLATVIETLARVLGSVTAAIPISLALLVWAVVQLAYTRRATRARSLARTPAGLDMLALTALSTATDHQLAAISSAPADGWRNRDQATIAALADLRLAQIGIRGIDHTNPPHTTDAWLA